MRKFTLSLLVAFITITTASAQIKKGTSMVGGSIYYNSQKSKQTYSGTFQDTKISNFSVLPAYGFAIKENLIVGGDISYSNTVNQTSNTGIVNKTEANSYGIGVFARPYKNLGTSGFYLYLQGRLGANFTRSKSILTNNGFNMGLGINPGIAYAITPKMHIETGLNNLFYAGYSRYKNNENNLSEPSYKSNGFSAGVGLGNSTEWTVGVKFFFGS